MFEATASLDYSGSSEPIIICCETKAEKLYRQNSVSREPDTVKWIESMPTGSCFWDVGANVGAYSLIAAKQKQCEKVIAFEPHWKNYNHLTENIRLNRLQEKIIPLNIGLDNSNRFELMDNYHEEAGSAHHQLGGKISSGQRRNDKYYTKHLCLTLDTIVNEVSRSEYDHNFLKIDVDGPEYKILAAAKDSFRNKFWTSVLIEINAGKHGIECRELLERYGYKQIKVSHKKHNNTIWIPEKA